MTGRWNISIVVMIALFGLVIAGSGADGARLKGYVTDAVSEDGIGDVWIEAWNDTLEEDNGTWSEHGNGYYEMNFSMGDFGLEAGHSLYEGYEAIVNIDEMEEWYNFTMEPYLIVQGYVNDSETGSPISNAWVWFDNFTNGMHPSTQTNSSGYYSIGVMEGDYDVGASASGYLTHSGDISVEDDLWYNFTLDPPNMVIRGYVTDDEGQGIEGVYVTMYQGTYYDAAEANETGYYELDGFEYYGHFNSYAENYIENWTGIEVWGEEFWLNFTLKDVFNVTVKGYVTNESKDGLYFANVEFSGPGGDWNNSEEGGFYVLNLRSDGWFTVYAEWEGLDFYGSVEVPEVEEFWYNITLHEPHSGEGEKYNVSGWVYDWDTEDPIEGAMVSVWSDMDSNDTTTNATGWFDMTLWAKEWIDVKAKATGYYEEWVDFDAEDINWTFWLEPANASKYYVKGHVYDDETDEPIENAKVIAESDADYNWTKTNATGWYYMEVMAEDGIEVGAQAEGYFEDWDWFDAENIREDFYLDPIPDNGTVTGFVVNETGGPIEGVMIGFMMMFGNGGDDGYDDFVTSDENGSYEIHGPAVLVALVVMDWNMTYFLYVHAVAIVEDKVIWHNITLYAFKENDTVIEGYVKDSEGAAVNDAEVLLYPTIPGAMMLQYSAYTDGDGRYEMEVPNGSYIAVVVAEEIEEWYIEYLEVDGDTWYNVSLVAVINETSMEIHFETWETGTAKMVQKMSGMREMFSRLFIDMVFGDSDGTVSAEEHDIFVDLFLEEFDTGDDFDEEDSKDDYHVDGVGYTMDFSSMYIYAKGDVVSFAAIEMKMVMELEINGTIEDADTHVIAMNITGDDEDNPFKDFTFYIPTGFWLENYTAPDGVTVTGVSVLEIEANDTAEGWLYMTVTSLGAPDPVVLDDPENIEGTSMDLSWSEFGGTDFQMYTIYRSTKMDSIGHPVADITYVGETEHTVTGLCPGVTYYFVIRTYITAGTYADSNQVSDSTPTTSSPGFDVIVLITYTPEKPAEDKTVTVSAVISNEMDESVTLTVLFLVDGVEKRAENLTLASGASDTLTFSWKAKKGTHNITVRAESGEEWSIDMEDIYVKGKSSSTPGFEILVVTAALVVAIAVRRRWH